MIALPLKTLLRPGFVPAFTKLCAEPLAAADKFRLARAKRELEAALADYGTAHDGLVRQYSTDGQGHQVAVNDPEKLAGFLAAREQLLTQPVTFSLPKLEIMPTQLDANEIAEVWDLLEVPL